MSQILRRCSASLVRSLSRNPPYTLHTTVSRSRTHQALAWQPVRLTAAAFHSGKPLYQAQQAATAAEEETESVEDSKPQAPFTKFEELGQHGVLHPNISKTITDYMGIHTMTEVQSRTINEALTGSDMIAKAKTGTGKTLAFLVPILQNIIKEDPDLATRKGWIKGTHNDTRAIIISPTRELAEQIAEEARRLTSRTNVKVQTAVGGTQKRTALHKMKGEGCHILVATPGRLNDLLWDDAADISAPKLKTLVMDEADRLLDAGFKDELDSIMDKLPNPEATGRQTLMFSATVPKDVVALVRRTLRPGFHYVNCVPKDEQPTHQRVPQKVVELAGLENLFPAIYELCEKETQASRDGSKRPFKAIVFFNGTSEVAMAATTFINLGRSPRSHPFHPTQFYEIYGKMSQAQRTRSTEKFRKSTSAILLSSDVTARGLDFPDVTHVIQAGLPRSRDDYIHRVGRTGRAGKEGEGWLFVSPMERQESSRMLHGVPLKKDTSLETAAVDMTQEARIPATAAKVFQTVGDALRRVARLEKAKVYGSYLSNLASVPNKQDVVDAVNRLAKYGWGFEQPPYVSNRILTHGGYGRTTGLITQESLEPRTKRALSEKRARREVNEDDPFTEEEVARNTSRGRSDGPRRYGDSSRGYGNSSRGYGNSSRGYGDSSRRYDDSSRGYGDSSRGYGNSSRGYGNNSRGQGERGRSSFGREKSFGRKY